jgi:hypothetical protein
VGKNFFPEEKLLIYAPHVPNVPAFVCLAIDNSPAALRYSLGHYFTEFENEYS